MNTVDWAEPHLSFSFHHLDHFCRQQTFECRDILWLWGQTCSSTSPAKSDTSWPFWFKCPPLGLSKVLLLTSGLIHSNLGIFELFNVFYGLEINLQSIVHVSKSISSYYNIVCAICPLNIYKKYLFSIFDTFNKCPLLLALAPSTWILCRYARLILQKSQSWDSKNLKYEFVWQWGEPKFTGSPGGIFHRTVFIFSLEKIYFIKEKVRFQTCS